MDKYSSQDNAVLGIPKMIPSTGMHSMRTQTMTQHLEAFQLQNKAM